MEYDISKFKSNKPPTTAKKKEYISDLLSTSYKFIKFNYLLCNRDIKKITVSDLYEQYCLYCNNTEGFKHKKTKFCLLYTSPSPRDRQRSRMPSSA